MIKPSGPTNAKIMIVLEGPSRSEELSGTLLIGQSGKELTKMLHEAGILVTECFITSVCRTYVQESKKTTSKYFTKYTPKAQIPVNEVYEGEHLLQAEINLVKPNLIIAFGELSLWALTLETGITKWRGSIIQTTTLDPGSHLPKLIPVYSPTVIIKKWDWRFIAVHDLRRCAKEAEFAGVRMPKYDFIIRPDFTTTIQVLGALQTWANVGIPPAILGIPDTMNGVHILERENGSNQSARPILLAGDIETRLGFTSCFGIAWSETQAITIPFMSVDDSSGYWSENEEIAIVNAIRILFQNHNIRWAYQNGIYDYQYHVANWGMIPHLHMDTMLAHHTCWSGLLKSLDFLSSLYCKFHRYWKDDGKEFHTSVKSQADENKYWVYNSKDCVVTYECVPVLEKAIADLNQKSPYAFQLEQFPVVLKMMLRGVRINQERKARLAMELFDALAEREQWMQDVLGFVLNPRSSKQMQTFFYEVLRLPTQVNRKTRRPTTDGEALEKLAKKEPLVASLVQCISEFRSIGVFLSTFVRAPLSSDGRMRCSYNIAGTETFRWSSSSDAFNTGMNLQNIPKGNEE